MNKPTKNQTHDIYGSRNTYTKVGWKVGGAIAFVVLGIFLWLQKESSWNAIPGDLLSASQSDLLYSVFAGCSLIMAAGFLFATSEHAYLDFTDRQIVTINYNAWFETSKRCRPLTDFSNIVVRHLCDSRGDGPDTFSGSVGFKPADGGPVLWLENFPANEDEVPRAANEFAKRLQAMTGLPCAGSGELKKD